MSRPLQNILARDILSQEISHAYILSGDTRQEQAQLFAMSLNCRERDEEGSPCGECLSCRKIADGNHPDIFMLEPERGTLRIEQTRRLISALALEKFEGDYKVAILNGCENMTEQAANNLLKTLEEPPGHTVFLLLCEDESQILPTVRSRCRSVRLADEQIASWDEPANRELLAEAESFLRSLPSMPLYKVIACSVQREKDRSAALLFVCALSELLMRALKTGFGRADSLYLPVRPDALLLAAEQTQRATEQLRANVNIRICLDMLFLRLWSCMKQG